jgi:DNA polymerase III alpha subunit
MIPNIHNTQLHDRVIWYDGDSTITANKIVDLVASGVSVEGIFTDELTSDINQYNKLVAPDQRITIKHNNDPLSFNWNIPPEFSNFCVFTFVRNKLLDEAIHREWITTQHQPRGQEQGSIFCARQQRVEDELGLYKSLGLIGILRVLIYVINTLHDNNIVWGVGRGSSVSSYVLYLIGIHDIDSVEYNLDIIDFLRTQP